MCSGSVAWADPTGTKAWTTCGGGEEGGEGGRPGLLLGGYGGGPEGKGRREDEEEVLEEDEEEELIPSPHCPASNSSEVPAPALSAARAFLGGASAQPAAGQHGPGDSAVTQPLVGGAVGTSRAFVPNTKKP